MDLIQNPSVAPESFRLHHKTGGRDVSRIEGKWRHHVVEESMPAD